MKEISELIGSKYPLIQGAMGVICNPELVAAVSEAGGYGLLTSGAVTGPDELHARMEAVRALTDKPLGKSHGNESEDAGIRRYYCRFRRQGRDDIGRLRKGTNILPP